MVEWMFGAFSLVVDDLKSEQSLIIAVVVPLFIALFAALFGSLAGARLATGSDRKSQLLSEIQENYLLSYRTAIVCSNALNLKQRRLSPMKSEYDEARQEFIAALKSGRNRILSNLSLIDMPRPKFQIDSQSAANLGITNFASQDLAQLEALQKSIDGFLYFWEERRSLIKEYRSNELNLNEQEKSFWYFGIVTSRGGRDSRFHDNMNNMVEVIDDIIFHSYRLYLLSSTNCLVLKQRLSRRERRQIVVGTINVKTFEDDGVFPNSQQYSGWLTKGKQQKFASWWWSEKKVRREAMRVLTEIEDR